MAREEKSRYKIGQNLKRIRAARGFSLEKVARLSDLSLNTVIRIESDVNQNPTIETLTRLAHALDVDIDDLLKD